jgi:two-component SAPR family response regulator
VVEKVVGKEPELLARFLMGTKWTVEKPEHCTLGEWIELGRKLRSAPDGEILSLIGSVETYLEDKLDDETFPSSADYREYFRVYAETIFKAARAELGKRNLEGLR